MYDFLQAIRDYEFDKALSLMPDHGRLLEIGAGAGWQAKRFHESGYEVEAVDIEISRYKDARIWPVTEYDGYLLPFPNNSFDIVFSSNVLEHIPHLEEFQNEIHRVLKPTGQVFHIVPSPTWRVWTSLAHYPYLLKTVIIHAHQSLFRNSKNTNIPASRTINKYSRFNIVCRILYSARHGEHGMVLSEIYYFSRFYWNKLFKKTNWHKVKRIPMRITYSGYSLVGTIKSMKIRQILSYFIGSSSVLYILKHS